MDPLTLAALVVLALAALYAFLPGKAPRLSTGPAYRPGRLLIDHFEEAGKDAAGKEIEQQLGRQKASEIARSMGAAFGTSAPAAAKPAEAPPKA